MTPPAHAWLVLAAIAVSWNIVLGDASHHTLAEGSFFAGAWLPSGSLEFWPGKIAPGKLWDALWPLLAGAGLAALGAWARPRITGRIARWLPPGFIRVWLERVLARSVSHPAHAAGGESDLSLPPSTTPDRGAVPPGRCPGGLLERGYIRLRPLETWLSSWPVVGGSMLALLILLLWLLSRSGG